MKFEIDVLEAYPGYWTEEEQLSHVRGELLPALRAADLDRYVLQIVAQLQPTQEELVDAVRGYLEGVVHQNTLREMVERCR